MQRRKAVAKVTLLRKLFAFSTLFALSIECWPFFIEMDFLARAALLATTLLGAVHSQFVSAPTDLISTKGFLDIPVRYKEVPEGICELTPGVKSYSGYVDISPHQHLFFWFFEARNQDPASAPLTVWINGGPGSPSMIGLFQENGPCGVDSNTELYYNPYSWKYVLNLHLRPSEFCR